MPPIPVQTRASIAQTIEEQHVKVSTVLSILSGIAVVWVAWVANGYEKDISDLKRLIDDNATQVNQISIAAARSTYVADSLEKAVKKAAETADSNSKLLIEISATLKQVEKKVDAR